MNEVLGTTAGNALEIEESMLYLRDEVRDARLDEVVMALCAEMVLIGGIEASLRRIAHFDYWQDSVRRSILLDAGADILVYGNAERAIVELSYRIARGEEIRDITDVRGTAFLRNDKPEGWWEIDSTRIDRPGRIDQIVRPYVNTQESAACETKQSEPVEE